MNLYKKVNDWLVANYTALNSWIYFNATPFIVGTVSMNSVSGDRVISQDVLGNKKKELLFAIDMVTEYDVAGTSNTNLMAMDEVNNFCEWLDTQENDKNYPDFGSGNLISKIEVIDNVPSLLVDTNQQLAKYQFQVRIKYTELIY